MPHTPASGPIVSVDDTGTFRIGPDGADWLGPGRPTSAVADGRVTATVEVDADRSWAVIALEALVDLDGLATGAGTIASGAAQSAAGPRGSRGRPFLLHSFAELLAPLASESGEPGEPGG